MGPGMKHLFFIDGGALAVENALKAAFDWKARKIWLPVRLQKTCLSFISAMLFTGEVVIPCR